MTSSFGMGSHQATLEEDVTLFNGQTSSSLTGQTSGLPQGQLLPPARHNVLGARDAEAHLALGHQFAVAENGAAQLAELRFHSDHFGFDAHRVAGLNRFNNARGGYMQDHSNFARHLRALQHQHGAYLRDQFQNNAGGNDRDAGGIPARGLIVDGKMFHRHDALPGNEFRHLVYE